MTEEKKPLKLNFTISLTERLSSYDEKTFMSANFSETVPYGVDPIAHAKKRIKEEIDRQKIVFDTYRSKEKEEKEEKDPLDF